jgi:hypothetical protein
MRACLFVLGRAVFLCGGEGHESCDNCASCDEDCAPVGVSCIPRARAESIINFLHGKDENEAVFKSVRDEVFDALKDSMLEHHEREELKAIVHDRESLTVLLRHVFTPEESHIHNYHAAGRKPLSMAGLAPPGFAKRRHYFNLYRVVCALALALSFGLVVSLFVYHGFDSDGQRRKLGDKRKRRGAVSQM